MTTAVDPAIRWLCRLVILLPVVVQGGIIALGLVPLPWNFLQVADTMSERQFFAFFGYSALCSASTIPLVAVAWKFRDRSDSAARQNLGLWIGIKRVFSYAL